MARAKGRGAAKAQGRCGGRGAPKAVSAPAAKAAAAAPVAGGGGGGAASSSPATHADTEQAHCVVATKCKSWSSGMLSAMVDEKPAVAPQTLCVTTGMVCAMRLYGLSHRSSSSGSM